MIEIIKVISLITNFIIKIVTFTLNITIVSTISVSVTYISYAKMHSKRFSEGLIIMQLIIYYIAPRHFNTLSTSNF